jgi:hypothetical protein
MSIALDNSFTILTSPSAVLAIKWIVVAPIKDAIFRHAVIISGLWSRDVYPDTQMSP